jgi:hypothetical protein
MMEDELGRVYGRYGRGDACVKVVIGKPNGRRLFRRQNYSREDKIKMVLAGVG